MDWADKIASRCISDGMGDADTARLIAAELRAEREACAKIAAENTDFRMLQDFGMQSMCDQLCTNIADAIRARGASKA